MLCSAPSSHRASAPPTSHLGKQTPCEAIQTQVKENSRKRYSLKMGRRGGKKCQSPQAFRTVRCLMEIKNLKCVH